MNLEKLKALLIGHEDLRLKPYPDTEGKLTIGVGRNLTDNGISREEAMILFDNDLTHALDDAESLVDRWDDLGDVRQRVLVDMAFNLGRTKLAKFKKTFKAINAGLFAMAAREMLDSRWKDQVGARAIKLSEMMRTGED